MYVPYACLAQPSTTSGSCCALLLARIAGIWYMLNGMTSSLGTKSLRTSSLASTTRTCSYPPLSPAHAQNHALSQPHRKLRLHQGPQCQHEPQGKHSYLDHLTRRSGNQSSRLNPQNRQSSTISLTSARWNHSEHATNLSFEDYRARSRYILDYLQ